MSKTAEQQPKTIKDLLNVTVRLIQPNDTTVKRNKKDTGTFQMIARVEADIELTVDKNTKIPLITKLQGLYGIAINDSYGTPQFIVNFENEVADPDDTKYPKLLLNPDINAILNFKVMMAYNEGKIEQPNANQKIIEMSGMSSEELAKIAENCMERASAEHDRAVKKNESKEQNNQNNQTNNSVTMLGGNQSI